MPPTFLMGLSLPFLVRALVREPGPSASRVVGYLYAVNVLGASVGALLTPWVLIRFHGIRGAVAFGAAANLIAGLGALLLGRIPPHVGGGERGDAKGTASQPLTLHPSPAAGDGIPRLWILIYGLSGFLALSLEIVWFRIVDVATKCTAFTFGTVLGVYLFGLGVGTLAGVEGAGRVRKPLHAFLSLQCLLAVYTATAVILLARAPVIGELPSWLYAYWGEYGQFVPGRDPDPSALTRLYVALPLALFGIPTALMGLSFVVLQRAVQDDPATSGRKVGVLQAANIGGCVLGSLGVGMFSLSRLGTSGTLRLIILGAVLFAAVGVRRFGARSVFGLLGASLLVLAAALPRGETLWRRLHGIRGGPVVHGEDATGLVFLSPDVRGPFWRISVNGRGASSLPFGWVHSELGAVPALVHPEPRDVAIVGLGSGDTAWAASCRKETRRTTVFEIMGSQPPLLERMASVEPWPDLHAFLADPRIAIRVMDARRAMDREPARYDLIEADPIEPYNAYSGNVYSLEFFRRCATRLASGGLMCSWAPSPRIRATFLAVFPHVVEFRGGDFLVGSNEAVEIDVPAWLGRLNVVSAYLGPSISTDVAASLGTARAIGREEAASTELNTDLFPRDEFLSP
jgi:hypothetical protein